MGYNNSGTFTACFWDVETSGIETSDGGTGLTTVQMQTRATFSDAGWEFLGETENGTDDIWRLCQDGHDYPRLAWEFTPAADFTCPDGTDLADLLLLSQHWLNDSVRCDTNYDHIINLLDYSNLSSHWLED